MGGMKASSIYFIPNIHWCSLPEVFPTKNIPAKPLIF